MHFIIHRKQFSQTNVTSQAFQQISDLKNFPACFRGPHVAHGPVVGSHCIKWIILPRNCQGICEVQCCKIPCVCQNVNYYPDEYGKQRYASGVDHICIIVRRSHAS